jgi:hypothetical protein
MLRILILGSHQVSTSLASNQKKFKHIGGWVKKTLTNVKKRICENEKQHFPKLQSLGKATHKGFICPNECFSTIMDV